MFSDAFNNIQQITHPVLYCNQFFNGDMGEGIGTFFIINEKGWFLTAGHVLADYLRAQKNSEETKQLREQLDRISNDKDLGAGARKKRIDKLISSTNMIDITMYLWFDGISNKQLEVTDLAINTDLDIAVGKIASFNPDVCHYYPKIVNPEKMEICTQLCHYGFTTNRRNWQFDKTERKFKLIDGHLSVTKFLNSGVYSGDHVIDDKQRGYRNHRIMLSSPAFPGQSGGPVFNSDGNICGVLIRVDSLYLGHEAKTMDKDRNSIPQFYNYSLAIHPETIIGFLDENGIGYHSTK